MSTPLPHNGKKKTGCVGVLVKGIFVFFAFCVVLSFVTPKLPRGSSSTATKPPISPLAKPTPQRSSPDFESGVLAGEAQGKERASQERGRPYPEGIQLMAQQRVEAAKPGDQKQWLKGFEMGFTRGWNSIRGSRNAEAYTQLAWETAKMGVRLYDIDEKHRATLVYPDRAAGEILVRYVEGDAVERKNLKEMARFWFVKKEESKGLDLSNLQPSELPTHVILKSAVLFELQDNKGSATAPSEARVELLHHSGGMLRIRFMGVEKELPAKETNFAEEVQAVYARKRQQELQEIEQLAAAEQAKLNAKDAAAKALRARLEADAGEKPSDARARTLVKVHLKSALHDPRSAEYESWSDIQYAEYRDSKYAWCITVSYRAKNAFGAYVRNQHTGYIRNGRLISFE